VFSIARHSRGGTELWFWWQRKLGKTTHPRGLEHVERKRIGEILVDLDALHPGDVDRVLEALRRRGSRGKFGQIAKDMGLIREEHILAALAVQLQLIPRAADLTMSGLLSTLASPNLTALRQRPTVRSR
jgi:hypothetical protein